MPYKHVRHFFFIMPENGFDWNVLEQGWLHHAFDNYVNGGVLYDWLSPGEVQFSEYSQQMLATMYQNHWNSEQERMRRMQEAGINPFAAAQGIAGVGGSQGSVASSPNSSVGVAGQNMAALGNTAANMLSAGGSTFANVAQGFSMLSKLRGEIDKIDSETQLNFENLGFTKLQSRALSTQLKYMDWKEKMSCFQALASYNNTIAEYDILKQEHLNKIAELDKIIAETDLTISLEEKANAEKLKIDEETRWQKADNDFWNLHGYQRGVPFYEGLRDAAVNGKSLDINALGDVVAGYEGKIYFARENAAAKASWNRRPSNAYEATAWVGASLGNSLKEFFATNNSVDALKKISSDVEAAAEFEEAYSEAYQELNAAYHEARKEYRSVKYSAASDSYKYECKQKRDKLKDERDSFSRTKFSELLVDKFTGRSSIK